MITAGHILFLSLLPSNVKIYNLLLFFMQESELKELSKSIMPKKAKRLYDRMQHGIKEKKQAIETLEAKRKAHEEEEGSNQSKRAKKTK
jgi:hypothetical protein